MATHFVTWPRSPGLLSCTFVDVSSKLGHMCKVSGCFTGWLSLLAHGGQQAEEERDLCLVLHMRADKAHG